MASWMPTSMNYDERHELNSTFWKAWLDAKQMFYEADEELFDFLKFKLNYRADLSPKQTQQNSIRFEESAEPTQQSTDTSFVLSDSDTKPYYLTEHQLSQQNRRRELVFALTVLDNFYLWSSK